MDVPSTKIVESRQRSTMKTISTSVSALALYFFAAHSVTGSGKQSLTFLALGAADGIVRTVGMYKYERLFSRLSIGRNKGTDRLENPARDNHIRSLFKIAGWFALSTGLDAGLALLATHDGGKAKDFMIYRGTGRLALSYLIERAWANCKWGVTAVPLATNAEPALPIPVARSTSSFVP